MPIHEAVPLGGTGEVLIDEMEPRASAAAKVASNVVEGAKKNSESPTMTNPYTHVKKSFKDLSGDGRTPFDLLLEAPTLFRGYLLHWQMLLPLVTAFPLMSMYVLLDSWTNTCVPGNQSGILVTLFLMMGESLPPKALAILSPARPVDEVPYFSMGWLSWTLSAIVTAVSGTAELPPKPEVDCKVLNMKSGQGRANNSFLLSRVLRDLELELAPELPETGGLIIEIRDALDPSQTLKPADTNTKTQVVVGAQVLLIGSAMFLHDNWQVLILTTIGGLLVHAIANMPAWPAQTFSARRDAGKNATYALMRGNGHNHVIVIRNMHADTYNLEDLAGAAVTQHDYTTSLELIVLCSALAGFLWLAAASMALSTPAVMYLLAIMGVGTVANIRTVALPRCSSAHGIPLEAVDIIIDTKVMGAIQALEKAYAGCGEPLLKEFFPGGVQGEDQAWFADLKESRKGQVAVEKEVSENLL